MRLLAVITLTAALAAGPAAAQVDILFGNGVPPSYREEDADRKFRRSGIQRALSKGTEDPACREVLRGLLTALAEVGPTLHKRDENFYVDPHLAGALGAQLTTPRFPAANYLVTMVRRVLIDKKLPPAWLETATAVNAGAPTIDVGKLRYLADGLKPIDSYLFSLESLRERYEVEITRANSVARDTADLEFKDAYLDREVAWGGLTLLDVGPDTRSGDEPSGLAAVLEYVPPPPAAQTQAHQAIRELMHVKKKPSVRLWVKLSHFQYVDVGKLPRKKRVMVRGRLWGVGKGFKELELREGLIFEDRDWAEGAFLADPNAVAACPLAVNELPGAATAQPGGFRQH